MIRHLLTEGSEFIADGVERGLDGRGERLGLHVDILAHAVCDAVHLAAWNLRA
jgi:hypothetical protein